MGTNFTRVEKKREKEMEKKGEVLYSCLTEKGTI